MFVWGMLVCICSCTPVRSEGISTYLSNLVKCCKGRLAGPHASRDSPVSPVPISLYGCAWDYQRMTYHIQLLCGFWGPQHKSPGLPSKHFSSLSHRPFYLFIFCWFFSLPSQTSQGAVMCVTIAVLILKGKPHKHNNLHSNLRTHVVAHACNPEQRSGDGDLLSSQPSLGWSKSSRSFELDTSEEQQMSLN